MNKKMKVSLRKSQAFCLALLCAGFISGNTQAKNDLPVTTNVPGVVDYHLDVSSTFSQNKGVVSKKIDYGSDAVTITFYFDWIPGVTYAYQAYLGALAYAGNFDPAAVDTNSTVTYNGLTYHKIKSSRINSSVPFYVSIIQKVVNDIGGAYALRDFEIPYVTNNEHGHSLRNECRGIGAINSVHRQGYSVQCVNNQIYVDAGWNNISGRSGSISFYAPKIPTETIIFNNLRVATTNMTLAISDVGVTDADQRAESTVAGGGGTPVFEFYLNGELRFDNSCQINGPVVIDIPLGSLAISAFTTKGGKPSGYTPKETKLTFTCVKDIPSTYGGMAWSISPTAISTGSGLDGVLVAKPTGANTVTGVGVKVTSDPGGNTAIKLGGDNLQTAAISGKNATATFYSYPTMTTDQKPTGGGDFEATATVMFEVP